MATSQPFKDYVVHFRTGDRIYSAGDPGTEMYIVQSGSVEIFNESGGPRVSLAIMEKGDFFGEMALIESAPHSNSAVALEDSDLIEINSTLFDKMIKGNIEIAVRMLRKLSIRLRDATQRLHQMASTAAKQAAEAPTPQVSAAAVPVLGDKGAPILIEPAHPGPELDPAPIKTLTGEAQPARPVAAPAASGPATVAAPTPSAETSGRVPIAGDSRPTGCHAVLLSEDGKELFHIVSTRAAIGRFDPVTGLKPEVDLSSLDLNRSVSRHHARLTLEGGVYNVTEEVGALNGTFINGKQLISGKPSRIKSGDLLSLGMVKLIFQEIES